MFRLLPVIVLAAIILPGCNKTPASGTASAGEDTQTVESKLDLNVDVRSPDMAVKSWWRMQDAADALNHAQCTAQPEPKWKKMVPSLATEAVLAVMKSPRDCVKAIYSREIDEVKVESETRAVVIGTIKNVTPVPATTTLDEYGQKRREAGEKRKYLLEKSADGWKIAQIYSWNSSYEILHKPSPWEEVYKAGNPGTYNYTMIGWF